MTPTTPPRKQCKTCPWRVGADPHAIPNGYSPALHRGLANTIADPGSTQGLGAPIRLMACHYSKAGTELACVGWLANQLGSGNNMALRLRAMTGQIDTHYETEGEQYERFEDTLPKGRGRVSRRVST